MTTPARYIRQFRGASTMVRGSNIRPMWLGIAQTSQVRTIDSRKIVENNLRDSWPEAVDVHFGIEAEEHVTY